jgi:hypothetical protein
MKRYAGERLDDGSVRVIVCDDTPYGEMFARWSELGSAPTAAAELSEFRNITEFTGSARLARTVGTDDGALSGALGALSTVASDTSATTAIASTTVTPPAASTSATTAPRGRTPQSFDWGDEGAGAVHLSRAILADCLGPSEAEGLYQDFEWSVIRGLPRDSWELDEDMVRVVAEIQPILRAARAAASRAVATRFDL